MLIGLTYDLRAVYLAAGYTAEETAEFDAEDTIDAIENTLVSLGHRTDRIGHLQELVQRLARGERWDLVFNIAEGLHGTARESQVPAILDAYGIPYTFSDPLTLTICLDKSLAKLIVRSHGIRTPDFHVVRDRADIECIDSGLPLFIKPLAEGTGKGVGPDSLIRDFRRLRVVCDELLPRYPQGLLIERYLPGREFTVGIVGTGRDALALGTLEIHLDDSAEPHSYTYVNKEECENRVSYRLVSPEDDLEVQRAEQLALDAWRCVGCRDAGRVDIRSDEHGDLHFIEVNPLAGLHPTHSDLPILCEALGIAYVELIDAIVNSAVQRVATDDSKPTALASEGAHARCCPS